MSNIKIELGEKTIGNDCPVFIIGEIGVNHNGDLATALKLIDIATKAGVDAVKFQKRNLKALYQQKILDDPNKSEQAFQYFIPQLKKYEFGEKEYGVLTRYCRKKGIVFLCTPFDIPSVDFLEKFDVRAYKIASADMTNFPLLEYIASKNKPMIVSTGMSQVEEIDKSVRFLKNNKAKFILLHCNSTYPAPFEDINLKFIQTMKDKYDVPVGYSGHERGISIGVAAIGVGAVVIERHITLDRKSEGPDHRASLEPEELKTMVKYIREAEKSLGRGQRFLSRGEILNRDVLGKSLVATVDIEKGARITKEMITSKGPGKGLSPQYFSELVGKQINRDIKKDDLFLISDIKNKNIIGTDIYNFSTKWGLKTRLSELDGMAHFNPKFFELHFSDKDLDVAFNNKRYNQELYIHAPEYWHHQMVDLCSMDEERRKKSVWVVQRVIKRAKEMMPYFKGRPKIVIHVGGMDMKPSKNTEPLFENACKSFEELDTTEVNILPENLPPRPWYFGGQWYQNCFASAEDLIKFCQKLNLEMTFDISHAALYCNLMGENLMAYTKKVAPFARHIHVADARGVDGEGLQIGEGDIDFPKIFEALNNYKWSWLPEIWKGHQNNYQGFMIALEKLKSFKALI